MTQINDAPGSDPRGTTQPSAESQSTPEWASRIIPGGSWVLGTTEQVPAIWGSANDVAWPIGESLMICGPAGTGKTTLVTQIIAARIGIGSPEVLGLPVQQTDKRVLYLAMDRPPQIARAMARLFGEGDREVLDEKLRVWPGPPPVDLARNPLMLTQMCEAAGADTVIVDSLKDGVLRLSDDDSGGGYNRARQLAMVNGIQVLDLHHQRKSGADNKKPSKLDDVYGSVWLTAGAGSVICLWGEAGDPVVEFIHLKQPAETLGPWMVLHDHAKGTSKIHHAIDVLELVTAQGLVGMTVRMLARLMFTTDKPSESEMQKARRKLNAYVDRKLLVRMPGSAAKAEPDTYYLGALDPSNDPYADPYADGLR